MGLFSKLFGTRSEREIKKLQPIVDKILAMETEYAALSEEALRGKTADFKARLVEELGKSEPMEQMTLSEEALARIDQIKRERYDTWEWNYGRSPGYTDTRRRRIEGVGTVEAALAVKNEVIREIRFFGDFFAEGEVSELEQKLVGCRCEREALLARLADCDCGAYIRNLTVAELIELLLA